MRIVYRMELILFVLFWKLDQVQIILNINRGNLSTTYLPYSKLSWRYAIVKYGSQIIHHVEKLHTVILYGKYWRNGGEYPKSKILPNLNYSGIHEYRSIFSGA